MKRILYSCLFLIFLSSINKTAAQSFGILQNPQCYNTTGVYTSTAYIVQPAAGAVSYTWNIVTSSGTCVPIILPYTTGTVIGTPILDAISYTVPCCGNYTIICFGVNGGGGSILPSVPQSTFSSGGYSTGVIFCQSGVTITPSSQNICVGSSGTLTGNAGAGATYTWSNGAGNTAAVVVSPSVNTVYSFTATTASGCTVSSVPATVAVQAITATVSPASQTMCAGSPVCFTAAANVVSNASVTPGTIITGYQWTDPLGTPFSTNASTCAPAVGGQYSVVVTHTGSAGTCTLEVTSDVVISTSIPVSISPVSPSVCPNGTITLTAISIQTLTASNHTWTSFTGTGPAVSSTLFTKSLTYTVQPPMTVTVDVDYFGCPGQATTSIGLLTLTPTLTSSAPLTCPGQSLTLTATGGATYSFTAIPSSPPGTTVTLANVTANTATHAPTGANLPVQYCVNAFSAGCVGSSCIVVNTKTLTPTLTASSASACPGTEFTLTTSGSGTGSLTTYTFSSGYSANIGTANPLLHTPPAGTLGALPQSYTVSIDSAGCQGVASVTIFSLTLNPILTSASPSICAGTPLTLSVTNVGGTATYSYTSSVLGFTNSSTFINTFTNNTVSHTPTNTATIINYTVAVDSAGCTGSDTYSIGILDLGPTLTLTTIPLSGSVCPGSTVSLNASGALSYTFTGPSSFSTTGSAGSGNTIVNSGTINVTNNIPLAGVIYTLQADSMGCVGSKTISIREFKLNPGIILTPTLVCKGQPVVITASNVLSNISSPTQYTFIALGVPPATLTPPGNTSFSVQINPTVVTVYSVIVDSMGCKANFPPTATINIRPDIPLVPSTSAASVCPGLTATLSVAAPTTALSYTYSWSQISGTSQITPPLNTSSLVTYPFGSSSSTYSVNVIDSLGCVGNTVISVGIDPAISFSVNLASSGSTICAGQSVTLTANSPVAFNNLSLGPISYSWFPSTGISPNTGTIVSGFPSITTVYTVIANNGLGCLAQNTITIPVGQFPITTTVSTAPGGVCVGFTATLTAFGANTYTWTGNTFTNSIAQQSISVGPGTYTVLGSNGGGCTNIAVASVNTASNLNVTAIASSPTTCIESNAPKFSKPVKLTASGAGTYVWFPYNPLNMTYSLGPQTDVRPATTTQYTVIGSTAICSGTGIVNVTVIPQFTINVTPPLPAMCLGDSLNLSIVNIGTLAVGPASKFTYSWTEALNAPPISMSAYFERTVTVYPQNTTTYTTEVLDSRGCVSLPRLVTVTVLPRPITAVAIPTINGVATNTVCFVGLNPGALDVTINLTANNLNGGLQFGLVPTYTWISPYAPDYVSILTPANSNAIIVNAPIRVINNSAVGVYTLISGYNGVVGCKRIDTVSVRVVDCRPVRAIKFTTAEKLDTICSRSCITYIALTDTMAGNPQEYKWEFKGGSPATSTLANPTVCYNFPSSKPYDVILRVSNPYPLISPTGGASGSALALGVLGYVKVVDIPNVTVVAPGQLKSDTIIRFGSAVNLKGNGALTYEWSPGYNISSLTKSSVTVNPFKTTQYILTGYNSRNCFSSDTINVIIIEDCGEMYVPNAFTPNNDGTNDVLYVRGICLQSLTFMVFNRWGEKVFETADQKTGWDGTYKGEELNTGVFVYRLEGKTYDGKAFSSKGNITLIR